MQAVQKLTDRKREAIIQAAISEFRERGFEVTSMDRIAARAEVSKRTVYNHFASKDELFTEILAQLWARSHDEHEQVYRRDQPLPAQLRELLLAKLRMFSDPYFMDLARVAISKGIHSPEQAREMVARLGEREENVTTWVRAAQADGKLQAPDPAFAAYQLQALTKAFAFWPQITMGQPVPTAEEQQQIVDSAVDMFLARYAVKSEPGR